MRARCASSRRRSATTPFCPAAASRSCLAQRRRELWARGARLGRRRRRRRRGRGAAKVRAAAARDARRASRSTHAAARLSPSDAVRPERLDVGCWWGEQGSVCVHRSLGVHCRYALPVSRAYGGLVRAGLQSHWCARVRVPVSVCFIGSHCNTVAICSLLAHVLRTRSLFATVVFNFRSFALACVHALVADRRSFLFAFSSGCGAHCVGVFGGATVVVALVRDDVS